MSKRETRERERERVDDRENEKKSSWWSRWKQVYVSRLSNFFSQLPDAHFQADLDQVSVIRFDIISKERISKRYLETEAMTGAFSSVNSSQFRNETVLLTPECILLHTPSSSYTSLLQQPSSALPVLCSTFPKNPPSAIV